MVGCQSKMTQGRHTFTMMSKEVEEMTNWNDLKSFLLTVSKDNTATPVDR